MWCNIHKERFIKVGLSHCETTQNNNLKENTFAFGVRRIWKINYSILNTCSYGETKNIFARENAEEHGLRSFINIGIKTCFCTIFPSYHGCQEEMMFDWLDFVPLYLSMV